MADILQKLSREMSQNGYKFRTVSISHLPEIQESVGNLVRQGMVNQQLHSNWHFYLDTNKNLPKAQTIFVIAIPQPITRVEFEMTGKVYQADIPPTYIYRNDEDKVRDILNEALEPIGYQIAKARLAIKTLAVRSGLAQYGKNNITYVPGFGSYHRLVAFYSDCPCEEDNWQDIKVIKACENCSLCGESCLLGSITDNRFLIHAEKCLTWYNERVEAFPDKILDAWHHTIIGCMGCQLVCPVNKPHINKIAHGPTFSESETDMILKKTPLDKLTVETLQKLEAISADEWYDVLPRNLDLLIKSHHLRLLVP
jgi:epoxyqueuosine reductase